VGVTRIESNRNRHFGLKIESKSIENRNLEIVTSLIIVQFTGTWHLWLRTGRWLTQALMALAPDGGTAEAAPPPFRPGNPALCGSRPLVTPY